ncbi:hypothetical protein B0I37DRAFT_416214 [Chaetomium sp. MPI-CAGE-AT-0009]|nr:hypothetical protein B0I37DRAFT_416214 [Chaetomium sp. MPI-CAGE-AT-0009]
MALDWNTFSNTWFRIIRRIVLGDTVRDDTQLTAQSKLQHAQTQLAYYIDAREQGSLPESPAFRALVLLGSHWDHQPRAAAEAAGPSSGVDLPFCRAIFLDYLHLWPTMPAILRELTEDNQQLGGGHALPKGAGIIVFAPFFHRPYPMDLWAVSNPQISSPDTAFKGFDSSIPRGGGVSPSLSPTRAAILNNNSSSAETLTATVELAAADASNSATVTRPAGSFVLGPQLHTLDIFKVDRERWYEGSNSENVQAYIGILCGQQSLAEEPRERPRAE